MRVRAECECTETECASPNTNRVTAVEEKHLLIGHGADGQHPGDYNRSDYPTTAMVPAATTAETKEQQPERTAVDKALKEASAHVPDPENEKPKAASTTDNMDVVNPAATPVFVPAIMEVDADTGWDAHAEMGAVQARLPEELPAADSPVQ